MSDEPSHKESESLESNTQEQEAQEQAPKEPERIFPIDYLDFDKSDARKTILSMPDHIRDGYKLAESIKPVKPFTKIFVAGMGGSGIAGDLLTYIDAKEASIPVYTIKDYDIPPTLDEKSLFIGVTYSGNTEETLSAYKLASRAGAQCILVASGGKAEELSKINKHPLVKLPVGLQPRMAIAYLFMPLLRILENAGVFPSQGVEVKEVVEYLRHQSMEKTAVALSEKLFEKTPIIYADTNFYPVAYRWKTQLNENAKTPAFSHAFSELNHNELLAWTNRNASFHVVILSTDGYHRRVLKRIQLTKDILQKKGVAVTEIAVKGSPLKRMFSAILLGDLTSYYLALRYEIDPTPVELIEKFKKDLGPFLI